MKQPATEMLAFRDLIAEMDALHALGIDSFFSDEAAAQFRKCIKELEDWQPEGEPSFDVLTNGLFAAIIGAHALHNTAMLQDAGGDGQAAADAFWKAQDFLRKAVTTLQSAVQHASGVTREVAASPSASHTIQ